MASLKRSTCKDTSSAAQIHERVHKKVTSEDLQNYTLIFCVPHIGTNLMTHVLNNSNYSNESQQAVAQQLKEMLHLNELKMCFGRRRVMHCKIQIKAEPRPRLKERLKIKLFIGMILNCTFF